jgi:hypothetical protein
MNPWTAISTPAGDTGGGTRVRALHRLAQASWRRAAFPPPNSRCRTHSGRRGLAEMHADRLQPFLDVFAVQIRYNLATNTMVHADTGGDHRDLKIGEMSCQGTDTKGRQARRPGS